MNSTAFASSYAPNSRQSKWRVHYDRLLHSCGAVENTEKMLSCTVMQKVERFLDCDKPCWTCDK
jgi:hypothetical protein